jgi:hypothetical protein
VQGPTGPTGPAGTTGPTGPAGFSEFQRAEDASQSQSASNSWIEKLSLTTTDLPRGLYRIGVRYRWRKESTTDNFRARLMLDNSALLFGHQQKPANAGTDQRLYFYWSGYQGLQGVHTLDLDYSGTGVSNSVILEALIELWRVQ